MSLNGLIERNRQRQEYEEAGSAFFTNEPVNKIDCFSSLHVSRSTNPDSLLSNNIISNENENDCK